MIRTAWSMLAAIASACMLLPSAGCVLPTCSSPSYDEAECRVVAENEHARLHDAQGVELRFQDPEATDPSSWDARGLLEDLDDGTVHAGVSGPGRFAISLEADADTDVTLHLRLDNLDPAASIAVGIDPPIPLPASSSPRRELDLDLAPGQVQWIRGERSCPARYRLAMLGDIQTNPTQFERILDRLADDVDDSEAAGTPLVALVIVGDLTESSRDDEFETMREILARVPIPVAVTPGNHDIYRPSRAHFNRTFGPGNHSFDVCGLHMVLLDSGSGSIAPSVQARLPELLDRREATFLVVGLHHPPYAGLTGSGWSREDQAAALLAELAREHADLIVAGHHHALRDYPRIPVGDVELHEVIVGTGGAYQGLGVPRFGYLRVTFDDDAGTTERCFVEVPPAGYAEPPNDPPSAGLPHCAAP